LPSQAAPTTTTPPAAPPSTAAPSADTSDASSTTSPPTTADNSAAPSADTSDTSDTATTATTAAPATPASPYDLSPTTTAASPTTAETTPAAPPSQSQVSLGDLCQRESHQLAADQAAVSNAQAALSEAQSANTANVDNASGSVNQASAAVAVARANQSVGQLPGTPDQIAAANASIATDTSNIATDNQTLQQLVLTAPFPGTIASTDGAVGDIATPDGVHNFSGPQPILQPSSGFHLFPAAPQQNTATPPQFSPVATIYSPNYKIVAQIAEGDVTGMSVGRRASASLPAIPGHSFPAHVMRVEPNAINQQGSIFYLVDLSVDFGDKAPVVLPGMTVDLSF
jgi:hypothetical protein